MCGFETCYLIVGVQNSLNSDLKNDLTEKEEMLWKNPSR